MKSAARLITVAALVFTAVKCGEFATEKLNTLTRSHVAHIDHAVSAR